MSDNLQFGITPLNWSTSAAPSICSGICQSFTSNNQNKLLKTPGNSGAFANVLTSLFKSMLTWKYFATSASTDFFDLSGGAKATLSGYGSGTILIPKVVETWRNEGEKTLDVNATYYPMMTDSSGPAVSVLSAVTPAIGAFPYQVPTGELVYGTTGLTHGSGIIETMTLTQEWTKIEEIKQGGNIVGAILSGFQRTISLELLATGAAPALNSTLTVSGAPSHAEGFKILTAPEPMFAVDKSQMWKIDNCLWIPAFV